MIVDYSEYITEKASKGIVNSVYVANGLPLFKHDSICPFCKQKIENVIHHKSKIDYPAFNAMSTFQPHSKLMRNVDFFTNNIINDFIYP